MDNLLRKIIYCLKRIFHGNIFLYRVLYTLGTLNFEYLKQKFHRRKYSSRFGGMWTDRNDFYQILNRKRNSGGFSKFEEKNLKHWRDHGYVIFSNAIKHELIDNYLIEIEQLLNKNNTPLKVTGVGFRTPVTYKPELLELHRSLRIVDDYKFSEYSRKILFSSASTSFFQTVFESPPILIQSFRYQFGSEEELHQDTVFVRINAPMTFGAIWVALEDVEIGSGELIFYPGSHNWEGFLFSGHFKHYDEERDGPDQLQQWYDWIQREAKNRNAAIQRFLPNKGDVIFWHGGLVHGGSPIKTDNQTRLSLVGHFCAEGVRPLYHYYKPGQRKFEYHQGFKYTTSHYGIS